VLGLNRAVNALRHRFGYGYWSLAGYLKSRVGNAMSYVHSFEAAAAHAARRRGLDGIVCGHIHRPEMAHIDGVLYCNDGDWVDSCSALIETRAGELELWNWTDADRELPIPQRIRSVARAA
jgi:UDP-2,3-diacylglucosamine pyrophosphatase LpxH